MESYEWVSEWDVMKIHEQSSSVCMYVWLLVSGFSLPFFSFLVISSLSGENVCSVQLM